MEMVPPVPQYSVLSFVGFVSLESSRMWLCYWILHSLYLLDAPLPSKPSRSSIIHFLKECQHPSGGFGGGPGQLPHLATTYSAIAALVTLGGEDALEVIDREGLMIFLLKMCVSENFGGGMTMHEGGEVDVRGCYCALASCFMLGMDMEPIIEACSLVKFVSACQSHEGGIGGEPYNEAHGGYAFCAFAALALAGKEEAVDVDKLHAWLSRMQGRCEGGMKGRTNKLVDGCYSWWQGGLGSILEERKSNEKWGIFQSGGRHTGVATADFTRTEKTVMNWLEADIMDIPTAREKLCDELEDNASRLTEECLQAEQALASGTGSVGSMEDLQEAARQCSQLYSRISNSVFAEGAMSSLRSTHYAAINSSSESSSCACNMELLQLYILLACQVPQKGGLRDKPGKGCDFYHTCYCLSGLAAAQRTSGVTVGGAENRLMATHMLCNVGEVRVMESRRYFGIQTNE